ncbi:MAG: bifunctional (p)ppGpp synthetase/guanosine-3',5'-bis(diphosphate) 3'-pyrophosphohydrolase [Actinobacteria bacterium]|nr:bifunctional (p)ppGpp synthetase/guanosine-3',5'-bis(diphosphate) 3'-pyrophosphohydrolase [Actinomycetota bacterium]
MAAIAGDGIGLSTGYRVGMATVERVRTRLREGSSKEGAVPAGVAPVVSAFRSRNRRGDISAILRAYFAAAAAHDGQFRQSGDPYITHPVAVATVVAELGLDLVTIQAALLHDAVEDTGLSLQQIEAGFGADVAKVVDGVTKLDRLSFDSREAQQAATFRKMLVAMAEDWRVLIIKLADRLHNMRTLSVMPEWKQRRIAQETLDVYAPLAHRLGIQEIRWQLEDLAFKTLHPKRYQEIEQMVATRAPQREEYLAAVLTIVRDRMSQMGIAAEVTGRRKHLWSIYEKMVVRGKAFDDIYDLVGIRVLVESEKDCWAALGAVHAIWSPVQGRFKDYVNSPKFNLYQSLHTTVVGLEGKPVEVQIRTYQMHRRAEFGIAAHWGYKEKGAAVSPAELAWFQRIADFQHEAADPAEFLASLKGDLTQDEVYVFTPKGKVIALPAGSTPVDFAYTVHTEVGHRCIGARVNGRLVPLDSKLHSADTVEIFTSKVPSAGPSRDWLQIVVTSRARSKIRQWFSRERREDAAENGREEIAKALRREGLPVQRLASSESLQKLAKAMNYADLDALHVAVGEGHVSARSVAQRLARELRGGDGEVQLPSTVRPGSRQRRRQATGVYVEGLDDVMVRLSRCCTPVPGDEIVGFVTRGRGVSVHRSDCANALSLTAVSSGVRERIIEVEWDSDTAGAFYASLEVKGFDRPGLLADVTRVVSEHHLNIVSSSSGTMPDRVSRMRFELELADPSYLSSLIASLERIDGVFDAYRVLPGKGG